MKGQCACILSRMRCDSATQPCSFRGRDPSAGRRIRPTNLCLSMWAGSNPQRSRCMLTRMKHTLHRALELLSHLAHRWVVHQLRERRTRLVLVPVGRAAVSGTVLTCDMSGIPPPFCIPSIMFFNIGLFINFSIPPLAITATQTSRSAMPSDPPDRRRQASPPAC